MAQRSGLWLLHLPPRRRALLGGVNLSNLRRGVAQTGSLGYWMGEAHAHQGDDGRGADRRCCPMPSTGWACIASRPPACRTTRPAARCWPSSASAKRARRRKYLRINGNWQDHVLHALLAEEYRGREVSRSSCHARPRAPASEAWPASPERWSTLDAELADGALPFVVEAGVEEQILVGRGGEPAIGLDLGIELAGAPAGIAQRQQALARAAAAGDGAQDVEAGGQRDILSPICMVPSSL